MYYTMLCAIVKDEEKSLKEWVCYHLAIGIEHIILYDNGSKISVKDQLRSFVDNGFVTVVDFPQKEAQQLSAYFHCLKEYGRLSTWIGFIDIDEFIVPLIKSDIRDFLDEYIEYPAIGIHWMMFSSSGHICYPNKNVIEAYDEKICLDCHIKSIIQPSFTEYPLSPHHFKYKDGMICVNEDKIPIFDFRSYPVGNKIQLNHYYFKSQQDFEDKIQRGFATQMKENINRHINIFYEHLKSSTSKDYKIFKYIKFLNKLMSVDPSEYKNIMYIPNDININKLIQDLPNLINICDFKKAIENFSVIRRYNKSSEIFIIGSMLYMLLGDREESLKYLHTAMKTCNSTQHELSLIYGQLARNYEFWKRGETASAVRRFIEIIQR